MLDDISFADICDLIGGFTYGIDQVGLIVRLLTRWLNDGLILGTKAFRKPPVPPSKVSTNPL